MGSNLPTLKVNSCHGLIIKNHHEMSIMRERERERERHTHTHTHTRTHSEAGGEREGAIDPPDYAKKFNGYL